MTYVELWKIALFAFKLIVKVRRFSKSKGIILLLHVPNNTLLPSVSISSAHPAREIIATIN